MVVKIQANVTVVTVVTVVFKVFLHPKNMPILYIYNIEFTFHIWGALFLTVTTVTTVTQVKKVEENLVE